MRPRTSPNYGLKEVEALIEGYAEHRKTDRPVLIVRFLDVERAFFHLSPVLQQAVLVCGIVGLPIRDAEAFLGIPHQTIWNRYRNGVEQLTACLNGGPT